VKYLSCTADNKGWQLRFLRGDTTAEPPKINNIMVYGSLVSAIVGVLDSGVWLR